MDMDMRRTTPHVRHIAPPPIRCTLYGLCVLCVYILDINANLIERDNDSQLINNFIGYSFLHDSFTWETVNVVNVLWRFSL